jgi:hypothetical protein
MKVVILMTVLFAVLATSVQTYAAGKDKSFLIAVDGQTSVQKNGYQRTWVFNNIRASRNGDGPLLTGLRYDEGFYATGEECWIQGEVGTHYELRNFEFHDTMIFRDDSTLQSRLRRHTICEVSRPGGLNEGTYQLDWDVTGGTKRFEGATGAMIGSGNYKVLVSSGRFSSAAYEGTRQVSLD